jgi:hypothetical protein
MMHRLAYALCRVAGHMLPAARKPWADAMTAELSYTEDDHAALAYAGGCLLAALRERVLDFDTRFTAGLWSIAVITSLFALFSSPAPPMASAPFWVLATEWARRFCITGRVRR